MVETRGDGRTVPVNFELELICAYRGRVFPTFGARACQVEVQVLFKLLPVIEVDL
ncbi:unnamed protein product, partial [Dicrocoelium dendriticum]